VKQIIPGVSTFTGLIVGRVYVIEDVDGLTVIDAGLDLAANTIVRQLQAIGRTATDVKRIVITHAHPDHIGGLPKLKALTGAQVIASSIERPVIEGKVSIPGRAGRPRSTQPIARPTPVDREVQGGETLKDVMGGLQVIFTPGHAPGHMSFWQPERRVLFCGDVLMNTLGLRLPIAAFTVDMDENKRSIRCLAELNAAIVCFGHGAPLTHHAAQRMSEFARRITVS
jgi:glyoxylase-like metal-dependent hydrolase (beta-lactamase superfamily II)